MDRAPGSARFAKDRDFPLWIMFIFEYVVPFTLMPLLLLLVEMLLENTDILFVAARGWKLLEKEGVALENNLEPKRPIPEEKIGAIVG